MSGAPKAWSLRDLQPVSPSIHLQNQALRQSSKATTMQAPASQPQPASQPKISSSSPQIGKQSLHLHKEEREHEPKAYVFVDNSNLMIGAKNIPVTGRDGSVLLNVDGLVETMCEGYDCVKRVVAGSNIPKPVRESWERHGFDVKEASRLPGQTEKFVDEALHSCIASVLLNEDLEADPQTLIIATGDGNETERTNSFPALARAAARRGWRVVICSWLLVLSPRFHEVRREFPELVTIRFLDDFRDKITFRAPSLSSSPPSSPPMKAKQAKAPQQPLHQPQHPQTHFQPCSKEMSSEFPPLGGVSLLSILQPKRSAQRFC